MNEHRYFAHLAESALAAGNPLAAELAEACRAIRHQPRRVNEAIAHAKDGDVGLAMERLRLDRIVSAVALVRPAATAETSARLRDLPSPYELVSPVLFPAVYLVGLLALQISISLFLVLSVLPRMPNPEGPRLAVGAVAAFLGLVLLAGSVFLLLMQIRTAATGGIPALLLRHVRAARLFAAAAVIVRHGTPAPEAIARLAGPARVAEVDAAALLGSGTLDAASLETLSAWLAGEGTRRSRRMAARCKTIGAGILVLTGVVMVGAVYRSIGNAGAMFDQVPF